MRDDENNSPHTAHTLNPVPFSIVGPSPIFELRHGALSDIAPTVLDLLNIDKPLEMTGYSLIEK